MKWEDRAYRYLALLKGVVRGKKYYRCGHCRMRKVLARELWEYSQPPKCEICNVVGWVIDMTRYKEFKTKTGSYAVCRCDGLHHEHRPGSSVWCIEHKVGPSEADYIDRYGEQQQ